MCLVSSVMCHVSPVTCLAVGVQCVTEEAGPGALLLPQGRGQEGGKFVPLYSKEGMEVDVVRVAGRRKCECQAVKHGLVSNCLGSGRIVCSQEGSGPCLFCGTLDANCKTGDR